MTMCPGEGVGGVGVVIGGTRGMFGLFLFPSLERIVVGVFSDANFLD